MGNVAGRQQQTGQQQQQKQQKQQQQLPLVPASPEAQDTYRTAFAACGSTLDVVGQAGSAIELEAACGWWRVCMARALPQCRDALAGWKVAAAETASGSSLQAEDMAAVTAIAPWAALASCVEQHAGDAGVATASTLQHVATVSGVGGRMRYAAQREWTHAAHDCDPMRKNMQQNLLSRPEANTRDEVLLMQVWMFGLASRLQRCKSQAESFAQHAQIADMTNPLGSLNEDLWSLENAEWQTMEDCIHVVAAEADADLHEAWRPETQRRAAASR